MQNYRCGAFVEKSLPFPFILLVVLVQEKLLQLQGKKTAVSDKCAFSDVYIEAARYSNCTERQHPHDGLAWLIIIFF